MLIENQIGTKIINACFEVHTGLGPGLLESAYEACLLWELIQAGLEVKNQKPLPVVYKGIEFACGFRADLLVEEKVIVEIKAVESIKDVHLAQVITYLKLSGCKLGYLINFNVAHMKNGIKRVVMNL